MELSPQGSQFTGQEPERTMGCGSLCQCGPGTREGSTGLWPRSSVTVSAGVTSEYSPQSGPGRLHAPDRRRERAGVCAHAWEDGGE